MSATSVWGCATWWMLTRSRQVRCNLQVTLCDPYLSALSVRSLYKSTSLTFIFYSAMAVSLFLESRHYSRDWRISEGLEKGPLSHNAAIVVTNWNILRAIKTWLCPGFYYCGVLWNALPLTLKHISSYLPSDVILEIICCCHCIESIPHSNSRRFPEH